MNLQRSRFPYFLVYLICLSSLILFVCSSCRHALFQSNAYDLGIFDNGIYLISQGQKPFVVFFGIHILGDHAALILYALALLYKITPNIHWLFAVQAIALSLAALPIFFLARLAGLPEKQAKLLVIVYLLYPLVFNANLFDFHPEVVALPFIFTAILAAKLNRFSWFVASILIILSCKAVLALTVVAMGIWLVIFEKKTGYGVISIFLATFWFIIASWLIIPAFSGSEAAAVDRYAYLGDSILDILKNLFLQPWLIGQRIFSVSTLEYLILLFIPIAWGISWRHLTPLIGAIPIFFLNIFSESAAQRNLVHHYSLPILPFLLLTVIYTLANGGGWLGRQQFIFIWVMIAFLALGKYGYFTSIYLQKLDTWQATRSAINLVKTPESILTNTYIAPHLTHRTVIEIATEGSESTDLNQFVYVLLNLRHPGWASSPETISSLIARLRTMPQFQLRYNRDDVFLFEKTNTFKQK